MINNDYFIFTPILSFTHNKQTERKEQIKINCLVTENCSLRQMMHGSTFVDEQNNVEHCQRVAEQHVQHHMIHH